MPQDSRLASNESGHTSTNSMKSSDVKTPVIFSSGDQSALGKIGGCMSADRFFDPLVLCHFFAAARCRGEGTGLLLHPPLSNKQSKQWN